MSILLQNKEKLHGKIYFQGKCIGSGVPFLSRGRAFVATCHHVLFEESDTTNNCDIKEVQFKVGSQIFKAINIVTTFDISKGNDVLVIELNCEGIVTNFAMLSLCIDVETTHLTNHNPRIITSHPQEETIAQVPLTAQTRSQGQNSIESSVEKGSFHNLSKGRGGASEYAGISGSGLFMTFDEKIYLLGLLSKIPKSSIEEIVILKRIDSLKTHFPESRSFHNLLEPDIDTQPTASIKDVCFVNYTDRSKDFYYERYCDKEFNFHISDNMNTWLHGKSGTGKTALVARNLSQKNVKHIACNLQPVTIDSCESIFQGLIDDITQYVELDETPEVLDVRSMSKFFQACQFEDNTIITIDEMSCSSPQVIEDFSKKIVQLISYYQQAEPAKNIIFVISSIFHPKEHGCNAGKLRDSFEFVCSTDWVDDIEKLFDIQNEALGKKICDEGKRIILNSSKDVPRYLAKIVQTIYRHNMFSITFVTSITERIISEYKEHE